MAHYNENRSFAVYTNLSFPSQLADPKLRRSARLLVEGSMISEDRRGEVEENGGLQ